MTSPLASSVRGDTMPEMSWYDLKKNLPGMLRAAGRELIRSGEGLRTVAAALDESVPVIRVVLFDRFLARGEAGLAEKLLSAMRRAFGGHAEKAMITRAGVS